MEVETRILLTALRNFLDRPEVKDKTMTAVMPVNPKLGDLSGKIVDVPLTSVFQGLTNKLSFTDMAKTLDDNNDVVRIFIEELSNELQGYTPSVEDSDVSFKDRGKAVDAVAEGLVVDHGGDAASNVDNDVNDILEDDDHGKDEQVE